MINLFKKKLNLFFVNYHKLLLFIINFMKKKKSHNKHHHNKFLENNEFEKILIPLTEKLINLTQYPKYILIPADLNDYSLKSTLNELNINLEKFLEIIKYCLSKPKRFDIDNDFIYTYLFFMKEFVNILKKQNNIHFTELIKNVAIHLEYIYYKQNSVICKYGDKGKQAYILLNGSVDILIKNKKNYNLTEKDFHLYLATLIKYNEFSLLVNVIKENYSFYPFEIIDDFEENIKNKKKKKYNSRRISVSSTSSRIIISSIKPFNIKNLIDDIIPETKRKTNEEKKSIKLSYLLDLFDEHFPNFDEYTITNISSEDYINRLKVYKPINNIIDNENDNENYLNEKIINVIIYEYILIVTKKTGSLIGEIALGDRLLLRTATMITNTNCDMGILNKKSYDLCIKGIAEKQRRQTISILTSFPILKGLSYYSINKNYFNDFITCYYKKGEKLITQFEFVNSIYLIREGDFDISTKLTFNEVIDLIKYYIDKIKNKEQIKEIIEYININYFNEITELRSYFGPDKFKKFMEEKHIIKLFTFSSLEVIGIDTYINIENGNSFYDIECSSLHSEILSLSKEFYEDLMEENKIVKKNNFDMIEEKNIKFIKRFMVIRENIFNTFYIHQSKKAGIKLENEIENLISKEKKIKIYKNGKRNFSFSNTKNYFKNKPNLLNFFKQQSNNLKNKNIIIHSYNQTMNNLNNYKNKNNYLINEFLRQSKKRNFPSIEKNSSIDKNNKSPKNYLNTINKNELDIKLHKLKKKMFKNIIENSKQYKSLSIDELNKSQFNDKIWGSINFNKTENKTKNIFLYYPIQIEKKNFTFFNISSNEYNNDSVKNDNEKENSSLKIYLKPLSIRKKSKGRFYYNEMRQLQIKLLNKKYMNKKG